MRISDTATPQTTASSAAPAITMPTMSCGSITVRVTRRSNIRVQVKATTRPPVAA